VPRARCCGGVGGPAFSSRFSDWVGDRTDAKETREFALAHIKRGVPGSTTRQHLSISGGAYAAMGGLLYRLRMSRSMAIATGSLAGNVPMSASSSSLSKCSASLASSGEERPTARGDETGFLSVGSRVTVDISSTCSISIDRKVLDTPFFKSMP